MNPVALRLLNQQLIAPQFNDPAEVVSHMGAMQAQEYRLMRWAVEMRTKKPSAAKFKTAFDSGRIIRLHLMRGTWQILAAEDYWPFLELCAPKAISVIKGWMSSNKITIPDDEYVSIRELLMHTAELKGSATKEDFAEALTERNITMDDHRLSYHIRMAEITGVLCSGNLLSMKTATKREQNPSEVGSADRKQPRMQFKATYALTAVKIGPRPTHFDRDEALMRFTHKYFRSHQPATFEDFVWWSGLNISDCRRGIELLGGFLHVERLRVSDKTKSQSKAMRSNGRDFYLTNDCRTRGFRKGHYLLIPPYDEYLIGYKSRDIVLPPEHRHHAHNNSGIFKPIIAHDGIVCGNWCPFTDECQVDFFLGEHNTDLREEWAKYKHFLKSKK